MASDEVLDQEITPQERLFHARNLVGSQRALARELGIPRTTLQGIMNGTTRNPRSVTLERIAAALDSTPVEMTERGRSWAADTGEWTFAKLVDLQPPRGAESFQVVFWANNGPRAGSSGWRSLGVESPADWLMERGLSPTSVRRVIFDKPRGRP